MKGILKQSELTQSFQAGAGASQKLNLTAQPNQINQQKQLKFSQENVQQRGSQSLSIKQNPQSILKKSSSYMPQDNTMSFSNSNTYTMGDKEKRIEQEFQNAIEKEKRRQEELNRHEVKDLGRDTYNLLKNLYKQKNKISQQDPQILFDFWKIMSKSEKMSSAKVEEVKPLTQKELRTLNVFEINQHNLMEKKYQIRKLANQHPDDILLTLTTHSQIEAEEMEIVKLEQAEKIFTKTEKLRRKQQDKIIEMKANQKERMEQLYRNYNFDEEEQSEDDQNTKPKKLTPEEQKQKELEIQQEKEKVEAKMRDVFVELIIVQYKKRYPIQKVYKNRSDLMEFWVDDLPNKKELNLDISEDEAKKYIDDYFFYKCLDFLYLRRAKLGYDTMDVQELVQFYFTLTKGEKKRRGIFFESESDVNSMITYYLERAEEERQRIENEQREEEEKRRQYFEKIQNDVFGGKEIVATDLDTLAQPKDRLTIGKQLLYLRKQYPNDKILRKMILEEFQENKVAKHPLEYDCKDEVNEAKIQHRELVEVRHSGKGNLSLTDLEEPLVQRTKVLAELFDDEISNYYYHLEDRVQRKDEEKKEIQQQMKKLHSYLEGEAQRFIQLRKRRFVQKVPTINEFLSQLYISCKENPQYCLAIQKNFYNFNHGESKRLKKRSYPYKFKRYFFEVVRSYAADMHKDAVRKLPFWAPSGKNYKTLNYKVQKHSRDEKMMKRYEKYLESQSLSLWDNKKLEEEKLKVMMKFEEAKECRFEPMVGLRAPLEVKSQLKDRQLEYGELIQEILFSRQPSFEKWLERMGPDFKNRYPKVYKFGIYKRCLSLVETGQYREAATLLYENFKVDQIRAEFEPKQTKNSTQRLMFSIQSLAPDQEKMKKLKDEDFADLKNRRFLEDIYFNIIRVMDKHEEKLKKDEQIIQTAIEKVQGGMDTFDKSLNNRLGMNTQGQLTHNQQFSKSQDSKRNTSYNQRAQQPKTYMCPLKSKCPNAVKDKWPVGNRSNSVPIGADCEYAHTYAELKFINEKKSKLKALNQRISVIQNQLQDASQSDKKSWNPANNIFVKCHGCGPTGPCSICQLKNTNIQKIKALKQKSDAAYKRLSKSKSVQIKQEEKEKRYNSIHFKISSLQKADILYKKERYSEAFEIISQAALFVKQELEQNQIQQEKIKNTWSQKLHAFDVRNVTTEEVYKSQQQANAAQITLYAQKTGVIGSQKPNTNEFLNYQIQLMYLKVEKALNQKKKDIQIMKTKIEKLEEQEEKKDQQIRQPSADQKSQSNKQGSLLDQKYADLVSTQRKIKNLQNAIQKTEEAMLFSQTPAPWRPSSAQDAVLDLEKLNDQMMIKNILSTQNKFMKKTDALAKNTIQLGKSIYDRQKEDLLTNPLYKEEVARNLVN
ncbi:hypothetical protein ABPG74_002168 [Tetrahymena malaccensis]